MERKRVKSYDEQIFHLFLRNKNEEKKPSVQITFQVTDACNLACTYCYQINKSHHSMPLELAKEFIDNLLDGKYNNYLNYDEVESIVIDFIGGEPLLEIDLIDNIIKYFLQQLIDRDHHWLYRHRFSMCSNGVLYFSPKVQEFIQKYKNQLSFAISIDGNKQLHDSCRVFPDGTGSYDLAMSGVKHYQQTFGGDSMGSKMTIAKENVAYIYDALQNLIENDYVDINLNCVFEEGWNAQDAKTLYEQLKLVTDYMIEHDLYDKIDLSIFKDHVGQPMLESDNNNWCGGTGAMLAVDWKGDLYPCLRYMESSVGTDQPAYKIGTVSGGIMTNQAECDRVECLKCVTRRSQSTDECFNCPIASDCAWCSAYNYQVFGTADKRATFICIMHKARVLANAYFWNKMYRIYEPHKRYKLNIPKEWALEIIDESEWQFLKFLESNIVI